jgi:hypothetical protein
VIVWNHGGSAVWIVTDWIPGKNGAPAVPRNTCRVGPNQAIDLELVKLRPSRPEWMSDDAGSGQQNKLGG